MKVVWRMPDGVDYVMMQVKPGHLQHLFRTYPTQLGIPTFWARMPDGDFAWWPDSLTGEPAVRVDA